MITLAFGSVPKDGGTFTFYRNLRPVLLLHDIDLRCVSVGKREALLWEEEYADEGCVLLAPSTRNLKKQAQFFMDWCIREKVNIVIGVNSEAILCALPHLPEHIRVLARCANAFDHGYRITLSGRERLAAIIALTPRLQNDLIEKYNAPPKLVHLIPNGIDPHPFEEAARQVRGQKEPLRLGFLGRLEHTQKGVLHLPAIIRILQDRQVPFELQIAGKGKHRADLEKALALEIASGQVQLLGALPPSAIPAFLAGIDLFIFPSHFEGCPNALLEALMAGCVPLSWRIEGITDYILEEGQLGFLFKTGDYAAIAAQIQVLHQNRSDIKVLSRNIALRARERYTPEIAALAYAKIFHRVMKEPAPSWTPRPWSAFHPDPNFEHKWTEHLPGWLKRWGKKLLSLSLQRP